MADTVETLRADLDALRAEFDEFKLYALPVIDAHQHPPSEQSTKAGEYSTNFALKTGT